MPPKSLPPLKTAPALMRGRNQRTVTYENELTESQELFAQHVAQGFALSEAYRRSYHADKMRPSTIYRNASMLHKVDKVQKRIVALREKNEQGTLHDRARALDFALTILQSEATDGEHASSRLKAIELIMKHHGLLSEAPIVRVDPHEGMSAADLRTAIQERLLVALGPVTDDDVVTIDDTGLHDDDDTDDSNDDDDMVTDVDSESDETP